MRPGSGLQGEIRMSRRKIDFSTYPRKEHFWHFIAMDNPFASVTVHVDITEWLRWQKEKGYPFFLTFQYAVVQAANRIPELRQRYIDGNIVEYDFCNPSYTVAAPDGTYRYCMVNTDQPLEAYLAEGKRKQEAAAHADSLEEEGDVQSLLFTTCVPWVHFSAAMMPYPDRTFTIPNIGWGKCVRDLRLVLEQGKPVEKEIVTIPVILMVNHALVDGRHMAAFFSNLEEELRRMRV